MKDISVKEFLLSKGINSKRFQSLSRKIKIDKETFEIEIDTEVHKKLNSVKLNSKQVFSLVYKTMDYAKYFDDFRIIYTPKELTFLGVCNEKNDFFYNIKISEMIESTDICNKNNNIFIIDKIENVFIGI